MKITYGMSSTLLQHELLNAKGCMHIFHSNLSETEKQLDQTREELNQTREELDKANLITTNQAKQTLQNSDTQIT